MSGYFIDNINWNSIFNVNVPVGIIGLFATYVIQREYKTERVPVSMSSDLFPWPHS